MGFYERWMHKREKYFAMLNDNRIVHPFGWGTEFIGEPDTEDAHGFFHEYSKRTVAESESFFRLPELGEFAVSPPPAPDENPSILRWKSAVETPSDSNNTVVAHYFPNGKNNRAAVVVLPHWNAKEGTYFDLCHWFNRVGLSALRLTLPYHEERMPPELERADYLVAPNIGRTLQSVRQSVLDLRASVRWLKQQGYEKVGFVGTSIGSCVGFLAFVHDEDIDAAVFNHVSGYFADVVWDGLSTYHVREGLEGNVELDDLREFWRPISPIAYMDKLASARQRPQRYIFTTYDLTFPLKLSEDLLQAVEETGVEHVRTQIPCGHYTLGEKPWVFLDGYKIISFLWKSLK